KELKMLDESAVIALLKHALTDKANGLGHYSFQYEEDVLTHIAQTTGDARTALNILEDSMWASEQNDQKKIVLEKSVVNQSIENKGLNHDKKGDIYYNLLSGFQKSIRGSDVQAALYYLARLLEGGDIISICRRLLVIAYEDVGLANPEVCAGVLPVVESVEWLRLPEERIPLSVIVVELCLYPKSNSAYKGLDKAMHIVKKGKTYDIKNHLKDTHYQGAKSLGHGDSYKYPHHYAHGLVYQEYLTKEMQHKTFY